MKNTITLLLAMIPIASNAAEVPRISSHGDVDKAIETVHAAAVKYDELQRLDGATYSVLPLVPVMKMEKSQSRITTLPGGDTEGFVWIVLRAVNVADSSVYPKFGMDCTTKWNNGKTSFVQKCIQVRETKDQKAVPKYAVDKFDLTVTATSKGPKTTHITYVLDITTNDDEVKRLKAKMLPPETMDPIKEAIRKAIASFFGDTTNFIRAFYTGLQASWVKSI